MKHTALLAVWHDYCTVVLQERDVQTNSFLSVLFDLSSNDNGIIKRSYQS